MQLVRDLHELPSSFRGGAVAIGNFDGVHRGHGRIVERLLIQARQRARPAVVFTFDPHPIAVLRPDQAPPPLTWTQRKAELLGELGVDAVIAYPTDMDLLQRTATEFFDQIIVRELQAVALVEGPNFYFGRGRAGDVRMLNELAGTAGIELEVVEPLVFDGDYVSSSRVRNLIRDGQIEAANHLLTRPFRVRGEVVHGAARGATIGFPTANLAGIATLVPAPGVYAGRALLDGRSWTAAVHLGPLPTFGVGTPVVEAHLLDFSGDLYGRTLEIEFLARLRGVVKFAGIDALRQQLVSDVAQARRIGAALSDQCSSP